MMGRLLFLVALAASLAVGQPAFAHGLLMKLRSEGASLVGQVFYSNGTRAAGEWVEVTDLDQLGTPTQIKTGQDGEFRHEATAGHRYTVKAFGEEGHETSMTITAENAGRGALQDADAPEDGGIPAWALVGSVLLFSVIPAVWLQRRSGTTPAVSG